MSNADICASSLAELYDCSAHLLLHQGEWRAPAQGGPPGVSRVLEYMGYQARLSNPRHRLLTGAPDRFSPGQAAARFLYFLSGSDRRDQIELYAGSVATFSPDGAAAGGTAHGARLFHRLLGRSLFDRCIECLENDGQSNRAVIPFYWAGDVGCGHTDAPCLIAAMPYRRGAQIFMHVQMRAQELARLLAYDVFELTMLQEFIAAMLGLELGTYTHGAFALHYVERHAPGSGTTASALARDQLAAPPMPPMTPAGAGTRRAIVSWEEQLRNAIIAGQSAACLSSLSGEMPPYWFDLFAAAAAHALWRHAGPAAAAELHRLSPQGDGLLSLELEVIEARHRTTLERAHESL
jgi:thymidylate synthase